MRPLLLEILGEIEQFLRVAGEAGELGKDEPFDTAALYVFNHSPGLRVVFHRDADSLDEQELTALAKKFRLAAGITQAQAARDMGVKQPSIFHAEESPALPYTKLRRRMIENYSDCEIIGPVFLVRKKK